MQYCYNAEYYISKLCLQPHTEGGYYAENYKSDITISTPYGDRKLCSSIYFLLKDCQVSVFHRLKSDELWYFHSGCPLSIYIIDSSGILSCKKLGLNIHKGEIPQVLVPKNSIFGALLPFNGFSLVGCMVSPGFEYQDFELIGRKYLLNQYPIYRKIILKLTKPNT